MKKVNKEAFHAYVRDEIYALCVRERYFTRGTCEQYEAVFKLVDSGAPIMEIAHEICDHSTGFPGILGKVYAEIEEIVNRARPIFTDEDPA